MEEFLTVHGLADRLNVPDQVIYRLIRQKRIPAINIGSGTKKGRFLIPVSAFDKWVERQLQEEDLWGTE